MKELAAALRGCAPFLRLPYLQSLRACPDRYPHYPEKDPKMRRGGTLIPHLVSQSNSKRKDGEIRSRQRARIVLMMGGVIAGTLETSLVIEIQGGGFNSIVRQQEVDGRKAGVLNEVVEGTYLIIANEQMAGNDHRRRIQAGMLFPTGKTYRRIYVPLARGA